MICLTENLNIDYPICSDMAHEKMKGFLSFLVLWVVSKKSMTGVEIILELEKRKGRKLSPGTIYPVLKNLKDENLLSIDENKSYSLTKKGIEELKNRLRVFFEIFPDIDEMKSHLS
jgi:DNA-binding PadR family transcriptional regulator